MEVLEIERVQCVDCLNCKRLMVKYSVVKCMLKYNINVLEITSIVSISLILITHEK